MVTLRLTNAPNARDLGGWPAADGRTVRTGVLYRANALSRLSDEDVAALAQLRLACVIDFRSARELEMVGPDRLGPKPPARLVSLPIADPDNELFAAVTAMIRGRGVVEAAASVDGRPALADHPALDGHVQIDPDRLHAEMLRAYRWLATAQPARQAFGAALRLIAAPDALPLLFHCTAGKDRTGWLAAVILSALGVDRAGVVEDYLRTTELTRSSIAFVLDRLRGRVDDPAVVLPLLEAREEYLMAALAEVTREYADLDGYLRRGLDLDDATLAALRTNLLA